MMRTLRTLLVVLTILLGALAVTCFVIDYLVGRPSTPMTESEADRIFSENVRAGDDLESVERWLADWRQRGGPFHYYNRRRPDRESVDEYWMDNRGGQSVAKAAALKDDDVKLVICV